jgi:uncharacterized protein (TIGR03083 family)
VSTPSYAELVATVRREGEGIVSAAGMGSLDTPVKSCGTWTMRDLLLHVGQIYTHVARLVGERVSADPGAKPPVPDGADPVPYVSDALDELVDALSSADSTTPVWNWSPEPDVAAFWARRMAHESAVHRYDAQRAHGVAQPVSADVAHDGMDELVDVILPRVVARDRPTLPEATYAFLATDEGEWIVRTSADGTERTATAKHADVTVRGPSSSVLLACYGRVKWASLEVDGETSLLETWSAALRF